MKNLRKFRFFYRPKYAFLFWIKDLVRYTQTDQQERTVTRLHNEVKIHYNGVDYAPKVVKSLLPNITSASSINTQFLAQNRHRN